MVLKKIVTGYVPIQSHPRTAKEYGGLGDAIFPNLDCAGGNFSIHPFYETVGETWLAKLIRDKAWANSVTHSTADNPQKNTLAYMCVIHQKFAWLLKAAIMDPKPDVFVWLDYGIGHVPGVTAAVIDDFMKAIKPDDFAAPGCWPKQGLMINDAFPCWRYCGGAIIVPRKNLHKLYKAVKADVSKHILDTNNVSWEVNTMARIEATLPIRWYQADHDATMFSNYGATPCAASSPALADQSDATSTPTSCTTPTGPLSGSTASDTPE